MTVPSTSLAPPGEPRPDQIVAGARLIEQLGTGLLGSFWKGNVDGTDVAVHVLRTTVSEERRTSFVRAVFELHEATLHERPQGILAPLDVQRTPPGFRARLCAAGSVEDLPALRWPIGQRVEMLAKIAEALEWMHAHGLAHGALSASSVLLDDELEPWLAGLDGVHLALGTAADSAEPTALRAYASPEAKSEEAIDVRSDVFGLGRILHFLLASEHPDEPDEELPRLFRLKNQPEGLVRIVRKCTCLDPADRYPSVAALLADLARFPEHDAVGTPHPAVEGTRVQMISTLPPRLARRARASLAAERETASNPPASLHASSLAAIGRWLLVVLMLALGGAAAWYFFG
jgi:serine/threonine-protein kinase